VASRNAPRVYVDADVFVSVLKGEPTAATCLSVLQAAERKDIKLVASRLLPVEIGGFKGDRPGMAEADELISRYLDSVEAEWSEVDLLVAREARRLSWELGMRAADSIHLATAIRRKADYFMTQDSGYPHNQVIDGVEVCRPRIVWAPTLFDGENVK